jgi:hypothetical protein
VSGVISVLGFDEAGSLIARDLVTASSDVRGYDPWVPVPAGVTHTASDAEAAEGADLITAASAVEQRLAAKGRERDIPVTDIAMMAPVVSCLAQELDDLGIKVEAVRLPPGWDQLESLGQECPNSGGAGLEAGVPGRRAEHDVQDPLAGPGGGFRWIDGCRRGPYPDISHSLRTVQGRREQVTAEGPLDRLFLARVERQPDRVRILTAVEQAGRQRHDHTARAD